MTGLGRRLGVARRGPKPASTPAEAPTASADRSSFSWDGERSVLAPEHRDSLAEAERDAAYRWAAPAVQGRDVLDVGAGAGHGSALLKAAGARSVIGVDPDARAVELATRMYGEALRFVTAEPMALPLDAGSFDAVVCFGTLEAAPDPDAVIAELRRVLAKGGVLLASFPAPATQVRAESRLASGAVRDNGASAYDPSIAPPHELAGAFAHAELYRTGIRTAATVTRAEAAGAVPIDETVWLATDASEDRAVLVVASDGELPELHSVASLSGLRDLRAYREQLATWEARARRAEAEGSAKHWELVAAREAQRRLRKRLFTLEHRPLRVLSRVVRGKPARIGPGPPLRVSEREPEPWE